MIEKKFFSAFLLSSLNALSYRALGHKNFRDGFCDFLHDCHINKKIPKAVTSFDLTGHYSGGYSRQPIIVTVPDQVSNSVDRLVSGVISPEDLMDKLVGAIHLHGSYVSLWGAGARLRLSGGCFNLSDPLPPLIKYQAVGSVKKETSMHYKIVNGRVFFNAGSESHPHWIFRRRATPQDRSSYPVYDQAAQ